MPVINILSPHVADMIAAGEVVERPASVIKELVENSFDAGAKNITVEIKGGGATFIRVTDDGCGMSPEDAGVAFLRHATSKLRDEEGLERISTMGFRGEALAAISAVSKIELNTRRKGDVEGTRVVLEAGDIKDMLPWGCPEGTTMTVRDIFYNTPARLKFLKSDRSEASACQLAALRCALGHPEASVRFIRDGNEEFFSPGDGRQDSCVYALLGRDAAANMLLCTGENDGIRLSGYVSSPSAGRGNRREQYFFCNGRFIKSALLQAALEQAYKNSLLTGRYPSCVLYLDIGFSRVDVNVHPAKTEVKFTDEKKVFDTVYYAVLSALSGEKRTAQVELSPSTRKLAEPKADFYRSMSAAEFRANAYSVTPPKPAPKAPARQDSFRPSTQLKSPAPVYQTRMDLPVRPVSAGNDPKPLEKPEVFPPAGSRIVEKPVQNVEKPPIPDHKIVGEALKTYIIVEQGESLILIDKHAAHERMIFDRLKSQDRQIMAQSLLSPVTVRPDGADAELLEQNGELLTELGFEIEPFGQEDFIVRAVPADMDAGDVPAAIEEICEKLRRGKGPDPREARDEILHTVACKAAIKAGWDNDVQELERIVQAVLSGQVKYCPHGRPVSVTLTRKDLDKQFKRIV
ncbi:MAG: DNA mismatch repair endonuclease MutL [Candidatus Limivicinus sp.]